MPLNPTSVYQRTSVETAPKGRLLTMLYDRMVRDLEEADRCIREGRPAQAHVALVHAQDIVSALDGALDLRAWPDGEGLRQLYRYVMEQLLQANLTKDRRCIDACLRVVGPLRDTWHEAYRAAGEVRG